MTVPVIPILIDEVQEPNYLGDRSFLGQLLTAGNN